MLVPDACYNTYMFTFTVFAGILQSIFISLGVGSSTLAILNFFVAIKDGTIDVAERHMMGVVYVVLRVAMVGILLATLFILVPEVWVGGLASLSETSWAQCLVILVLFANAALMTARLMSSKFGPGIQAGSWYTLGIVAALELQGLNDFSVPQFIIGYGLLVLLAVGLVNGAMYVLRQRRV